MAVLLDVGGHTVAVSGDSAEEFLLEYEGGRNFLVSNKEPEWVVHYGRDIRPSGDAEVLSRFCFEEIHGSCCFSRCSSGYEFLVFPESDDVPLVCMRYTDGSACVEASDCSDRSVLRFSLWFAVTMLGAEAGLTLVHSSVIVYQGRAVLFLGESGTGKSTHTRLWRETIENARLLNDDSPVLTVDSKGVLVHGSPWSGKTPCYIHRTFPLAAVVRLSQAPYNKIRRLSVPEAFAAVQPSLPPALMQDDVFADRLVDIASEIISAVPVYHLECLPDDDAAKLSCSTVFGNIQ